MSALSDLENLRLHDVADGDVRDDSRWIALMGEDEIKAFLAGLAAKHLPGRHNQDSHGNDAGPDAPNPLDKLKLAGRIDLKPGEKLLSSQRIRTRADADGWDLMTAEVDTRNGRQVRLGIIHPDDSKHWTAGPDPKRAARIAELDAEIERLEGDNNSSDELVDRLGELQSERGELVEFDAGNLNRTAIVDPSSVAKMRADIDAGIERAKEWSKAWKKLAAEADDDDPRWDAFGDNDQYFIEGSVPGGPEGELHYLVGGVDDGEASWEIRLGVKPPSARDDRYWSIGNNGDAAVFAGSDVKKLLKALDELGPGEQPKSALGRGVRRKHLPGQHNQQSHAGTDFSVLADIEVLDQDAFADTYGTLADEHSVELEGFSLTAKYFENGDSLVSIDLPGNRFQVLDETDSDGMGQLAYDIEDALSQADDFGGDEDRNDVAWDVESPQHGFNVGVTGSGDIWLRPVSGDDHLELSQEDARAFVNALRDTADSYEDAEDAGEFEQGAKSLRRRVKHLPGRHDQRDHGRSRRPKPDIPTPDVPAPAPPKPRRQPKPKPPRDDPKPAPEPKPARQPRARTTPKPAPEPKPEPKPERSAYIAQRRTILANLLRNSDDPDVLRAAGQEWDEVTGGEPRPRPEPVAQRPAASTTAPTASAELEAHVADIVSKLPPGMRPGVSEGLLAQAAYVPKLLQRFKSIGFDVDGKNRDLGSAFGQYLPGYGIQLNHRWQSQRAKLDKSAIAEQKAGFLTPSGSKSGLGAVVAHEFGHGVALSVVPRGSIAIKRSTYDKLIGALTSSLGIAGPAVGSKPAVTHDTINVWLKRNSIAISRGLSGYSTESFHELLAEAWQEYTTRGADARPAAKAVGRALAQLAGGIPR